MGAPPQLLAAFGFISVLGAAANTPIAAAVMGIEVLPASEGVYAALAAVTAFLMVGHRSVYASQKLGFAKSAGLDVKLGGTIGELSSTALRIRKGSLTERVHKIARTIEEEIDEVTWIRPTGDASAAGDRPDRPRPSPPGARHDEPGD
jgi:hypothetical protein